MGEKTPAIYKNIRSFWQKCHLQRDQSPFSTSCVVEMAIFKGMDSGPGENVMAYVDELLDLFRYTTTFHQKTPKFPWKVASLRKLQWWIQLKKKCIIFNFNLVGFVHSSLCSRDFYFNGWFVFLLSEVLVDLHIGELKTPKHQSSRWNFLLGSFNKSMLDCL